MGSESRFMRGCFSSPEVVGWGSSWFRKQHQMKWLLLVATLVGGNGSNWVDLRIYIGAVCNWRAYLTLIVMDSVMVTSVLVSTSVSYHVKAGQYLDKFEIHEKFSECGNEKSCWRKERGHTFTFQVVNLNMFGHQCAGCPWQPADALSSFSDPPALFTPEDKDTVKLEEKKRSV